MFIATVFEEPVQRFKLIKMKNQGEKSLVFESMKNLYLLYLAYRLKFNETRDYLIYEIVE